MRTTGVVWARWGAHGGTPLHSKLTKLNCSYQSRKQSTATGNRIREDMFVRRVCPIAINTQAVEHGDPHGGEKISVGSSAHLWKELKKSWSSTN